MALKRIARIIPLGQLCINRGATALWLALFAFFIHSSSQLSMIALESTTTDELKMLRDQGNNAFDIYPQIPVALDPYRMIPTNVRQSWGEDCKGKCRGLKCAGEPRAQEFHEALTEVLAEWVRITNEEFDDQFTSMLMFGSLVSSLFCNATHSRWDHDMDASIWAHDTGRLEKFATTYNRNQSRFYLAVHPQWRIRNVASDDTTTTSGPGREMFLPDGNFDWRIQTPNARLFHTEKRNWLDLFPIYAPNQNAVDGAVSADVSSELEFDVVYKYLTVPRDWIFPLQPCYLNGIKTTCPARGGDLMGLHYGGDKNYPPKDPDHVLNLETGCWEKVQQVVCGGHFAQTCTECPRGHGEDWCHGDCLWCNEQCVSKKDVGTDCGPVV